MSLLLSPFYHVSFIVPDQIPYILFYLYVVNVWRQRVLQMQESTHVVGVYMTLKKEEAAWDSRVTMGNENKRSIMLDTIQIYKETC